LQHDLREPGAKIIVDVFGDPFPVPLDGALLFQTLDVEPAKAETTCTAGIRGVAETLA